MAAILYTSGTTGRSKGAMLTHGNLLIERPGAEGLLGWTEGDVLIHALAIFHVHGLFVALHGALLNGSKMLWFSKFDPKRVRAEAARSHGVHGRAHPVCAAAGRAGPHARGGAQHARCSSSGSAPLLIETFDEWRERTGHTILERYGMSETVMLTSNPYTAAQGERRGGTVGFALPGVQLRVRDGSGRDCTTDEIGNIEVSGPNVFAGYWRMPRRRRKSSPPTASSRRVMWAKIDG